MSKLYSLARITSKLAAVPLLTEFSEKRNLSRSRLKSQIAKARKLIETTMILQGIPGLSIAVSRNGTIVWKAGFGLSNVETSAKCTGDSVMRIASISKSITSALAASLFENGTLDLDSDIRNYLSDFPVKKFNNKEVSITMRQLLSHSSGIRHYKIPEKKLKSTIDHGDNRGESEEFLSNKCYDSSADALNIFKNDDLVGEPGTKYFYTTYGITLAGAVLEAVAGEPYGTLAQRLFSKLGMRHTRLDMKQNIVVQRVSYYRRNDNHVLENCPEVDCSNKFAGGGIISNVTDLLIFANAILYSVQSNSQEAILKKTTMKIFLTKHSMVNQYTEAGLGWFIESRKVPKSVANNAFADSIFYHTGSGVGASSALLVRPDDRSSETPSGICVAVLCNIQNVSVLPLTKYIADVFSDPVEFEN